MANNQHAVICPQGNIYSRKLYDPSGYTVMAPSGFKTFRTLGAAVLWATEKGYNVRISKPVKHEGLSDFLDLALKQAQADAAAAIEFKRFAAAQAEQEA